MCPSFFHFSQLTDVLQETLVCQLVNNHARFNFSVTAMSIMSYTFHNGEGQVRVHVAAILFLFLTVATLFTV